MPVLVNEPKSVAARLGVEVAAGRLEWDGAQIDAAARLDGLGANLREASQSLKVRLRASLPWLPARSATPLRGVYLWGAVGRGKTLLMDYFYESVAPTQRRRSHFYRFMRDVHAQLRKIKHRAQPLDAVAERLARHTRVICLDEFFVADIADAMLLGGLFEGLFRRGVTLVATSNVPPRDLYRDGLQRQRFLPAIALIEAHLDVVHLDGAVDYRLRQLQRSPTYLDSAARDTAAQLRQLFAALGVGAVSGPSVLTIEDRPIAALATGPGMAWFEFDQLCEGPRNQNDYIEIAHLYHTVFIANIPQFSDDAADAARRFIMLIDELYDRGVNLVVSAAAAPAALYHGERLQLEFQRAASRLVEMQTLAYLAGVHRP